MAGEALPPMDSLEGGLLDEMTRRAQERLLIFQVGQEVQVNLQNIEQALDAFFRDTAKRAELKDLPGLFAQVQGALMIMELQDAASLNAAVMARVQQFADGSADGTGEAAEMVADGLSALGLYINALQQGSANPREVLHARADPLRPRRGARRRRSTRWCAAPATVAPIDLDVAKQKVAALYEDWQEAPAEGHQGPAREGGRRPEERRGRDLRVRRSPSTPTRCWPRSSRPRTRCRRASSRRSRASRPRSAPDEPAPQMVQLVDAPGAEIDRELLEIFLEEATEVVATIDDNLAVCRDAPHDREALTTIRRGFHTLKGSGRMVGPHRPGRGRVAVRAGDEQVAEGGEARLPGAARLHRPRAGARSADGSWS